MNPNKRSYSLKHAALISLITVIWSTFTGVLEIIVGLRSGSLSLIGLGATVFIDVLSSVVLLHRFLSEIKGHPAPLTLERRAQVFAGGGLMAIALALEFSGVNKIIHGQISSQSTLGLILSSGSALFLPFLGVLKYRIAADVGSKGLKIDGHITFVGAVTSLMALISQVVTQTTHSHLVDPLTACTIGLVALYLGSRELKGIFKDSAS
ncbi:MAG: cation transporter [Acidimicrobiales bacterium]|nr:cation transporter [Acidimicrobiales bacterium]